MAEQKRELGWPEWLAMGVSGLSLAISAFMAFNSVLIQRDDIRFVPGGALDIIRDKNVFTLPEVQEFAFVNSGNRQAVISGISGMLVLVYAPGDAAAQCNRRPLLRKSIYLDAKPVILKPGDIQVVQAKVQEAYPWKRDKGTMMFKEDGKTEGAADYVVCIQAIVTTPDSSSFEWIQPLYSLPNTSDEKEEFEPKEPLKVLKKTRLGFG
jgi:hypothetical protein